MPTGKLIDVKKLIISKNKKLAKWLPEFVISWLKRVIHEDEVNEFITKHDGDDSFAFSAGAIELLHLKLNIKGTENIPPVDQSCIFVSNHPLGGLDAIAIIHLLRDIRPDIKFIVNDLLMHVEMLRDRFIGVNKVGKNALPSLHQVEEQFATGTATFIFPAGLVSRKIKDRIEDLDWKKTFVSKAKKYNKMVIPVHMEGRLTNRFYRLANLRKFFGIKLNIEMFYLVDELFKQRNTRINIVIGSPISPDSFTKSKSDKEWAQEVKKEVYKLREV
ncbi:MAG: glycerol acyltransferase [Cytophagales bacterium]|nr:glycerol acyltransferase [Cytophagales bacterium]